MRAVQVEIRCEGDHVQKLRMEGYTREMAESWCGLVDGSSPMYISDPRKDEDSPIGKCGICGRPVHASVLGMEDVPPPQKPDQEDAPPTQEEQA